MPVDLMPLHEIGKKYKKQPETIRLWITKGLLVDGERVKLPAFRLGGSWAVSEDSLMEYFSTTYANNPSLKDVLPRQRAAN